MTSSAVDRCPKPTPARTRWPRAMMASLVVIAMVLITGCGVITDPSKAAPVEWREPASVGEQARQLFTEDQITSAYDEITRFTFDRSFEAGLLDPQQRVYTADQINAGVVDRMTTAMRDEWLLQVLTALSGDDAEKDSTRVLRFFDWEHPDWSLPDDGDPVLSQGIREVEVDAAPATEEKPLRLRITLIVDAYMSYKEPKGPFEITVSKRISHWLVPADQPGDFAWLIDAYEGTFAVDEELPVNDGIQTDLPAAPPMPVASAAQSMPLTDLPRWPVPQQGPEPTRGGALHADRPNPDRLAVSVVGVTASKADGSFAGPGAPIVTPLSEGLAGPPPPAMTGPATSTARPVHAVLPQPQRAAQPQSSTRQEPRRPPAAPSTRKQEPQRPPAAQSTKRQEPVRIIVQQTTWKREPQWVKVAQPTRKQVPPRVTLPQPAKKQGPARKQEKAKKQEPGKNSRFRDGVPGQLPPVGHLRRALPRDALCPV